MFFVTSFFGAEIELVKNERVLEARSNCRRNEGQRVRYVMTGLFSVLPLVNLSA